MKTHYNNYIYRQKDKDIDSKIYCITENNKDTIQTLNFSPITSSFGNKNISKRNNLLTKIRLNTETDNNNLNNNLLINNKSIQTENNLKIIKNKLSNSRISTNNTFESNNEVKIKKIKKGMIEHDINNILFTDNKINVLNSKNNTENNINLNKLKNNSYVNIETPNKYKTILTKFNSNFSKIQNTTEEPNFNFDIFLSKYNIKQEKEKKIKNFKQTLFMNEEINKVNFHKLSLRAKEDKKYFNTELLSNIRNKIPLKKKANDINFPNHDNIKIFNNLFKRVIYEQKSDKKLIFEKIKNNSSKRIKTISNELKNKNMKKNISLDRLSKKRYGNLKKINGVKYSAINLNMWLNIPNRIIPIDNHGNEFNYTNKRKLNKNNKFYSLKQGFNDIKSLRKLFLNNLNDKRINTGRFLNNNLYDDNMKTIITKKHMHKTFYKNIVTDLNNEKNLIKINKKSISSNKNYYLLKKFNKKINGSLLNLKKPNKMELKFISI